MKQLVVISGKGGTGKTSIVASFAALADKAVLADCDVDAADLHLVLAPKVLRTEDFSGGSRAEILTDECIGCGKCMELCRFDAVSFDGPGNGAIDKTYRIDPVACEGCGVCAYFCPAEAIRFGPVVNGQWFISETRCGPMVHARLGAGEENSGKLVSLVRKQAERVGREKAMELIIIDGSPGIGCPVIASITAVDMVLAVTEPTLSGQHDLKRVAELTAHFGIKTAVCVNKWDLNEQLTGEIESQARSLGLATAGRVRYDKAITDAQRKGRSVVEYLPAQTAGPADDMRKLWTAVLELLQG